MRVFVALDLPNKTKENLTRSAEQMKHFATQGNWVTQENYHITLHFLGELAESQLLFVQSAMDEVKNMPAPKIALQQFVMMRGSDVVCAKIRQNGLLTELHDKLGQQLERLGFDVEHRAYRPHVTLVREHRFTLPFSEVTKSVAVFNKPFDATEVVLYQSLLEKSGPTYRELYRISLPIDEN